MEKENRLCNFKEWLNECHFDDLKKMKESILETIDPSEATNTLNSIMTIVDGKRKVAYISEMTPQIQDIIEDHGLHYMKVQTYHYGAWIVFSPFARKEATELMTIADKYQGMLSRDATDAETRRIGQILGYDETSIEEYIERKNSNNG